jgi:hypothetical protein
MITRATVAASLFCALSLAAPQDAAAGTAKNLAKKVGIGVVRTGASIGAAYVVHALGGGPVEMAGASYGTGLITKKLLTPSPERHVLNQLKEIEANKSLSEAEKKVQRDVMLELSEKVVDPMGKRILKHGVQVAAGTGAAALTGGVFDFASPIANAVVGRGPGSIAASATSLIVNGKNYVKAMWIGGKGGYKLFQLKQSAR